MMVSVVGSTFTGGNFIFCSNILTTLVVNSNLKCKFDLIVKNLSGACVTGSNFNKYLAACKLAELIDWTHKQLKRINFREAAVLFFVQTKENILHK